MGQKLASVSKRAWLVLAMLVTACTGAPPSGDDVTWLDAGGRMTAERAVIDRAAAADYILLGEIHDNPKHHAAQARILEGLVARGRRPAVVWEMVRRDQAGALAAASGPEDLAKRLDWANSGWPDFALYRPIAEAAFAHDLTQAAGNLPLETLRAISQDGLDALPSRADWGLDPDPGEAVRSIQADAVFAGHCELIPRARLSPLVEAQLARDGSLAAAMVAAKTDGGAVLIAGAGHTRLDAGVPFYLARLDPGATVFAIGMTERADDTLADDTVAAVGPYDATGVSAMIDRPDPCEKMRRFMERHREAKKAAGGKKE